MYEDFEGKATVYFDELRQYEERLHTAVAAGALSLPRMIEMGSPLIAGSRQDFVYDGGTPDTSERPTNPNRLRAITTHLINPVPLLVPRVGEEGVDYAWLLPAKKTLETTVGVQDSVATEHNNNGRGGRHTERDMQTVFIPKQAGGVNFATRTASGEEAPLLQYVFEIAADDKRLIFDRDGSINTWRQPAPQLKTEILYSILGEVLAQETFDDPGGFVTLPASWMLDEFLANEPPTTILSELIKCAHYSHAYATKINPSEVLTPPVITAAIQGLIGADSGPELRRSPLGNELQVLHGDKYQSLQGGVANAARWLFRGITLPREAQLSYDALLTD